MSKGWQFFILNDQQRGSWWLVEPRFRVFSQLYGFLRIPVAIMFVILLYFKGMTIRLAHMDLALMSGLSRGCCCTGRVETWFKWPRSPTCNLNLESFSMGNHGAHFLKADVLETDMEKTRCSSRKVLRRWENMKIQNVKVQEWNHGNFKVVKGSGKRMRINGKHREPGTDFTVDHRKTISCSTSLLELELTVGRSWLIFFCRKIVFF